MMEIIKKGEGGLFFLFFFILSGYLLVFSPSYDVVPWIASKFDDKRFLEFSLIAVILCYYICKGEGLRGYGYAPLALLGLLLISSCLSKSPIHALRDSALFIGLFFLADFVRLSWFRFKEQLVVVLIYGLLFSAGLYVIAFYTGYLASILAELPLRWPNPFFGFSSVRFFNQYQVWGLPILPLFLLLNVKDADKFKKVVWVGLALWWSLLFASGSKGALLAIFGALLVTVLLYRGTSLPFLRVILGPAIIGLLLYGLLFFVVPHLLMADVKLNTVAHSTQFARIDLWAKALEIISENPLFGVGPMHYAWYPNHIAAHPHNSVLQIGAEWGIPALVIVLGAFGGGVLCWIKKFNSKTIAQETDGQKQLVIALFCSLMAGVFYSLVSGVIVMPLSQVMGAVVIGLMLGVYHAGSEKKAGSERGNTGVFSILNNERCIRLIAAATLILLVWSVMPELLPRLTGQEAFLPDNYKAFGPRFWQVGGIPHQ